MFHVLMEVPRFFEDMPILATTCNLTSAELTMMEENLGKRCEVKGRSSRMFKVEQDDDDETVYKLYVEQIPMAGPPAM